MELETAPEAGVTGVTVVRDRHGLYIAKAPKSLRVHQGGRGGPRNPPGFKGRGGTQRDSLCGAYR